MTTLLIGGDVCPTARDTALFEQGRADRLFHDLRGEFEAADFSVVNLECPLIARKSPIEKDGPPLGAPVGCIDGLKAARIDAVNLANNHILDHGEQGLLSTLGALAGAGVAWFGAGASLEEARKMLVHTLGGGGRVALLGVAEHEFSIAGKRSAGANPLDVIEIARGLRQARHEYDWLIVLVHGGREHYPYPSPRLQQVCGFLVELGAAAVVCQHSHCAGCYEYHHDAPIVYGQGNLVFDSPRARNASWHEGFLVRLTLLEPGRCTADWIPFSHGGAEPGARRMPPEIQRDFLLRLAERSREIAGEGAVERLWLEYCRSEKYLYASRLKGHNRLMRLINRKLRLTDWLCSRSARLMRRNVVECETHREVLETLWRDPETIF